MSGQKTVIPTADGLAASVRQVSTGGLPPVHLWNPPFCGDLDMRIARDGSWYYQGSKINRAAMVKLFSSILKFEDGHHYLVTPVEKFRILVEDAPFVAQDFEASGQGQNQVLTFFTHVGEQVICDADHPVRLVVRAGQNEPTPYIEVRSGLVALIDRKSFYRLTDLGVHHDGWFGIWSSGAFSPLLPSDDLSAA